MRVELNSLSTSQKTKRVIVAVFMAAAIGGCSATTPPPETSAQKQVLATFDVNKCEQQGPGLYKCPAVDKPVCSPDYNGPLECVRIGKNGSVYLAAPTEY